MLSTRLSRFHVAVSCLALLGLAVALVAATPAPEPAPRPETPPREHTPAELFPGQRFDPSVPPLRSVVGVQHGARPLRHRELLDYVGVLAARSRRAVIRPYAESHEGRPLVLVAISDAETIGRLDEVRAEHRARLDPRGRRAADDARALAGAKAVAWLGYSIHGDELSGADAAAAMVYFLIAGEGGLAEEIRRELVVLIDPLQNPDGRERYLAMTSAFAHRVDSPDAEDLSHTAVWPWGRGNHYLFDLNRDWFSLVQPESARTERMAAWNPQIVLDVHEMGADSSYLFPPPRHPFNPHLPKSHGRWWARFSADQAAALDARGYGYFTREWNEEFFPGYGSSWPAYRGALGILHEMSRTSGTRLQKRDGVVRTFAQGVEHQVASSVANLRTLVAHKEAFLADFVAERRAYIERARSGGVAAYLFPETRDPAATRALVGGLVRQGIEVFRSEQPVGGTKAYDLTTGRSAASEELGTPVWSVPVAQPAGPLVRTLLDPHVPMPASFLQEQREYLERGRGSRLYDATAWSLPLAWGVEAYWTPKPPRGRLTAARPEPPRGGRVDAGPDPGRPYGYLIDGRPEAALGALSDLLARKMAVRVADRPFETAGHRFGRGSLLVPQAPNGPGLAAALAAVAARHRVRVVRTASARSTSGPDLGGVHFKPVPRARIGIFTGWPVTPPAYGALWHLLDTLGVHFVGLNVAFFRRIELARYNVLVFPDAFGDGADAYRAIFGGESLERLKAWIRAGGTAIGIGAGAELLADRKRGLTKARLRREALDRFPPVVLGPDIHTAEAAGPFVAAGLRAPPPASDAPQKRPARSPYDVAPIIGPGAQPFTTGVELGTPVVGPPVSLADWLAPSLVPPTRKPKPEELARADRRLRRFHPSGAFVRLELDPEVFLAWGLPRTLPAYVNARDTLVAEPPVQVAARFSDVERLHLGGLVWPETAARWALTAYVTREAHGRGQIILFLNPPNFRGWTRGTRRILLNALMLGPAMGTAWNRAWAAP